MANTKGTQQHFVDFGDFLSYTALLGVFVVLWVCVFICLCGFVVKTSTKRKWSLMDREIERMFKDWEREKCDQNLF